MLEFGLEEFDFKLIYNPDKKNIIADAWTCVKDVTPRRGPRRPPLFNFDGKKLAAAVEKEEVDEPDPVLQEIAAAADEEQV
jgi:hypothetical protein